MECSLVALSSASLCEKCQSPVGVFPFGLVLTLVLLSVWTSVQTSSGLPGNMLIVAHGELLCCPFPISPSVSRAGRRREVEAGEQPRALLAWTQEKCMDKTPSMESQTELNSLCSAPRTPGQWVTFQPCYHTRERVHVAAGAGEAPGGG